VGVTGHFDRQDEVFLTVKTQKPLAGAVLKFQSSAVVGPSSVSESGLPDVSAHSFVAFELARGSLAGAGSENAA
jgi:hypothetical protein